MTEAQKGRDTCPRSHSQRSQGWTPVCVGLGIVSPLSAHSEGSNDMLNFWGLITYLTHTRGKRSRASGSHSGRWQEQQKRGGLCMMDAKPERAWLTSCVCLPGATWAGFSPSSDKERDPCFSQPLCTVQLPPLPGNKLVWCVNKGGSLPSNMAGEPPGLRLKTSHPRTGLKFPLISQVQAHSHREWMNPAQKCCQSGQNQG